MSSAVVGDPTVEHAAANGRVADCVPPCTVLAAPRVVGVPGVGGRHQIALCSLWSARTTKHGLGLGWRARRAVRTRWNPTATGIGRIWRVVGQPQPSASASAGRSWRCRRGHGPTRPHSLCSPVLDDVEAAAVVDTQRSTSSPAVTLRRYG